LLARRKPLHLQHVRVRRRVRRVHLHVVLTVRGVVVSAVACGSMLYHWSLALDDRNRRLVRTPWPRGVATWLPSEVTCTKCMHTGAFAARVDAMARYGVR
jgi:hypothetical protein